KPKILLSWVADTSKGPQPSNKSRLNSGSGSGITQMVSCISPSPHRLPVYRVMVYVPGSAKTGRISSEPVCHELGASGSLRMPKDPLARDQPVAGLISQTNRPWSEQF